MASLSYVRETFENQWFETMSELLGNESLTKEMFDTIDNHYRKIKVNQESPIFFILGKGNKEVEKTVNSFIKNLKDVFGKRLFDSKVSWIDEKRLETMKPFPSIICMTLCGIEDFQKAKRIANKYKQTMIIQYTNDNYSFNKDAQGNVTQFQYSHIPDGLHFITNDNFHEMSPFLFGGKK